MNIEWKHKTGNLRGSRWAVYESHVKNKVEIPWTRFKDEVVTYNPVLRDDGWLFISGKEYILPQIDLQVEPSDEHSSLIENVSYFSQMDNPHTDGRYWGSDPDRGDDTPDGCWMNELPDGGHYGREAEGCPGPMDKGCIRPGSCNVTALFMLMSHFNLQSKPAFYPDGTEISPLLKEQPLSPTWLYVYMMDFWGGSEQKWNGVDPTSACNSIICGRGDYMQILLQRFIDASDAALNTIYTTSVTTHEYSRSINSRNPVVISSRALHHVILGIGYEFNNGTPWITAHDPYGKKRMDLKKWDKYNGCGDHADYGREVRYPFDLLDSLYMLYCTDKRRRK